MIYLVHEHFEATLRAYLEREAPADLVDRVRILHYEDLPRLSRLPWGTYVFSDLEVATPATLAVLCRVHERLAAEGDRVTLLNDPHRVRRRYDLLRAAHACGLNDFTARRATEPLDGLRFPVFVREEREHSGTLTPLLGSPPELEAALRRLTGWLTGHRRDGLLVVEFRDMRDEQGRYHNFSAFKVGDRILPRWVMSSFHWSIKARRRLFDRASIEKERDYLLGDPHQAWLRRAFALARLEYGRIDYGVRGDVLQMWEINSNPTVGPRTPRPGRLQIRERVPPELLPIFDEGRSRFDPAFAAAMAAVDRPEEEPGVALDLDPAELHLMQREQRRWMAGRRRRRRLRRLRGRLGLGLDVGGVPESAVAAAR